jgi:hypothetical protein
MLQHLTDDPLQHVLQWLTITDILAVRSCARPLHARMTARLCGRPRPPPRYYTLVALFCDIASVSGSELFLRMYAGHLVIGPAFVQKSLDYACYDGWREKVQWLVARFGPLADIRKCEWKAFRSACASGNLALVQWLVERFVITAADMRAHQNYTSLSVCRSGNVELLTWLIARFGEAAVYGRMHRDRMMTAACVYGRLPLARWLAARFCVVQRAAWLKWALRQACGAGHAQIVQWLVRHFRLGPPDAAVYLYDNGALTLSCAAGHRDLLQWLVAHFRIEQLRYHTEFDPAFNRLWQGYHDLPSILQAPDAADQLERTPIAFYYACQSGSLDLAQWLAQRFGVRRRVGLPLQRWVDAILRGVCNAGHLPMARWLVDHFQHGPHAADGYAWNDEQDENEYVWNVAALQDACGNGHLEVAQWFVAHFQIQTLTLGSVRQLGPFIAACGGGRLAVAKWLAERFRLRRNDGRDALHDACRFSCIEVVQWLVASFQFTVADIRVEYHDGGLEVLFSDVWCCGDLASARWLVRDFKLTLDDVAKPFSGDSYLRAACIGGHLPLIQLLVTHYQVPREAFGSAFEPWLEEECSVVGAAWLRAHYDLPAPA